MKLELRHLAPYLPYELEVTNGSEFVKLDLVKANDLKHSPEFKPILRPLSDLTKADAILYHYNSLEIMIDCVSNGELEHSIWLKLIERHFDVFGLIPNGLAKDINQLNR